MMLVQGLYLPGTLLGFIAFSGFGTLYSFYLEHILSNAIIPVLLVSTYYLFQVAVYYNWLSPEDEYAESKHILYLFIFASIAAETYWLQMNYWGPDAMYYTANDPDTDEDYILPSIFYLLRWAYQTPRVSCAEYTYVE